MTIGCCQLTGDTIENQSVVDGTGFAKEWPALLKRLLCNAEAFWQDQAGSIVQDEQCKALALVAQQFLGPTPSDLKEDWRTVGIAVDGLDPLQILNDSQDEDVSEFPLAISNVMKLLPFIFESSTFKKQGTLAFEPELPVLHAPLLFPLGKIVRLLARNDDQCKAGSLERFTSKDEKEDRFKDFYGIVDMRVEEFDKCRDCILQLASAHKIEDSGLHDKFECLRATLVGSLLRVSQRAYAAEVDPLVLKAKEILGRVGSQ